MTPYYSDDAPVAYHYSRQGRNTMSYDDGKYAFGVDDFGWDLTPPPEDFGYVLGWAALGETLETQPEWQQIPNVLTFDTGVIPFQEYERAADMLDEFERRCPAPEGHANHVPAVAALLRSKPEVPFFGIHGTSVSENPFKLWIPDEDDEDEGTYRGLSIDEFYVLGRHGKHLPKEFR